MQRMCYIMNLIFVMVFLVYLIVSISLAYAIRHLKITIYVQLNISNNNNNNNNHYCPPPNCKIIWYQPNIPYHIHHCDGPTSTIPRHSLVSKSLTTLSIQIYKILKRSHFYPYLPYMQPNSSVLWHFLIPLININPYPLFILPTMLDDSCQNVSAVGVT